MTSKRSNPAWSMAMIAALFVTACNPILTESKMPDPGVESAYNCCEKIAFVSDREGNKDIYIMDTDGSNVARLTATILQTTIAPTGRPTATGLCFSLTVTIVPGCT